MGEVSEPIVESETRSARALERRLRVPPDLVYLSGHFETFPLVAGVVQVHWAMRALRELLGSDPEFVGMEALKFKDVLLPEQSFNMRVELSSGGDRMSFRLWEDERVFSTGRCLLGDAEGAAT